MFAFRLLNSKNDALSEEFLVELLFIVKSQGITQYDTNLLFANVNGRISAVPHMMLLIGVFRKKRDFMQNMELRTS